MGKRTAEIKRKTNETDIVVRVDLDGTGKGEIDTGIGFFDHMLEAFARFSGFDISCASKGDLNVDCHHTVEDVGIVLGDAIREALSDKKNINRAGFFIMPMDDALCLSSVDFSGRPYLGFDFEYSVERIGELETETIREFFYALSVHGQMNIHIKVLSGSNMHHITEAMFKSLGKAVKEAVSINESINGVLSTKGVL